MIVYIERMEDWKKVCASYVVRMPRPLDASDTGDDKVNYATGSMCVKVTGS